LQFASLLWPFKRLLSCWEWNQWEKVISSLDSYFCWSPPVVLGNTVCSIGPKYIFHTVVGRFFFKNIFDSAIWYINQ
jgi:hypothetical protein